MSTPGRSTGPYIGATGFTSIRQINAVLDALGNDPIRKLGVGVLASPKSLRREPLHPWHAGIYPAPEHLSLAFVDDPRTINLLHVCVSEEDGTDDDILSFFSHAHALAGYHCDGIQINMDWPSTTLIRAIRQEISPDARIVVQIGSRAISKAGSEPDLVASMIMQYGDCIDDILLDMSGGKGIPLDPTITLGIMTALAATHCRYGIGVAGGLGPDSLSLLDAILPVSPSLSIDAERQLRTPDGPLDVDRVTSYVRKAMALFT